MKCTVKVGTPVRQKLSTQIDAASKGAWSEEEFRNLTNPTLLSLDVEERGSQYLSYPFDLGGQKGAELLVVGGRKSITIFLNSLGGGIQYPTSGVSVAVHCDREPSRMFQKTRTIVRISTNTAVPQNFGETDGWKSRNFVGPTHPRKPTFRRVSFHEVAGFVEEFGRQLDEHEKIPVDRSEQGLIEALSVPKELRTQKQKEMISSGRAYIKRAGLEDRVAFSVKDAPGRFEKL